LTLFLPECYNAVGANGVRGGEVARVFLGIGSNLGFRYANISKGLQLLKRVGFLRRVSSVLETAPVGPQQQPPYLNMVVELITDLSPFELLRRVQKIERAVGRTPTYRWGPRVLDIDILLYDSVKLNLPRLTIPHPQMSQRPFVMEPLAEIAPDVASSVRSGA
jgi:2-amino-4-hydroxy-6-hydroxymethyldihydropteridine diphosphokinase